MVDIEEAAADEFSLDHPAQGLKGLRKSLEQTEAGRIMLSKAMSSVCYERSHPGRYPGGIVIPSNIYKKSNPQSVASPRL